MGRWTQYDEVSGLHCYTYSHPFAHWRLQDDYRLPEGMERIGYDADTMQYCFRDRDGSVWQGSEGAEFGKMTRGEQSFS